VRLVCGDLYWTKINRFFSGRVSEALIGESNDADGYEQDSDNGLWFHEIGKVAAFVIFTLAEVEVIKPEETLEEAALRLTKQRTRNDRQERSSIRLSRMLVIP